MSAVQGSSPRGSDSTVSDKLQPGIYQGQDGHEYQVFVDGSSYRRVYREVVKRDRNGNKFITRGGPTLVRMGTTRLKKPAPAV